MDFSFDNLLSNYLLASLTESEKDIEDDKKSIEDSYEAFFESLNQAATLLVKFCNKYKSSNDFKDLGLSVSIENKFQNAKKSYYIVTTKANEVTNPNFEKLVKYLNDAYYAYVFLLRGFNSIINAYNKNHPQATVKRIDNVPEPQDLGTFTDSNVSNFVKKIVDTFSALVVN